MAEFLGLATVKISGDMTALQGSLKLARNATIKASASMSRALKRTIGSAAKATARTIGRAFKSAFRGAVRTVKTAAKIIIASLIAIGVATSKMAADAEESENLFEVSMGNMAVAARKWSEEVGKALGINRFELRKQIATFNVMLNSMGLTEKESFNMSKALTQLSQDMASFFNLKPEIAFLKLQAGITGEIEPLKRLGILVNETTIKNRALKEGVIEEGEALTEIQKVQLRYAEIVSQTQKAQGDLARTLSSTTNVWRSLKSIVRENMVVFGRELLPAVNRVGAALKTWFVDNRDEIKKWGEVAGEWLGKALDWFDDLLKTIKDEGWVSGLKKIGAQIKEAFKITLEFLKPHAQALGKIMADAFIEGAKRVKDVIIETAKEKPEAIPLAGAAAGTATFGVVGGVAGFIAGQVVALDTLISETKKLKDQAKRGNKIADRMLENLERIQQERNQQGGLTGSGGI